MLTGNLERIDYTNTVLETNLGVHVRKIIEANKSVFYHNIIHVKYMINLAHVLHSNMSELEFKKLMVAIMYHDIVYVPGSSTNERESVDMLYADWERIREFMGLNSYDQLAMKPILDDIANAIILTNGHGVGLDRLASALVKLDLWPLLMVDSDRIKTNAILLWAESDLALKDFIIQSKKFIMDYGHQFTNVVQDGIISALEDVESIDGIRYSYCTTSSHNKHSTFTTQWSRINYDDTFTNVILRGLPDDGGQLDYVDAINEVNFIG